MNSLDLYSRLITYAKSCQAYIKATSNTQYSKEFIDQLIRSSTSPGANYIEAIEAVSKKDFTYRLKICRKEIKESIYWITLIENYKQSNDSKLQSDLLINEANQLIKIFTASILTAEKNQNL